VQALLEDYVPGAGLATDLANTAPSVWHGEEQLTDVDALLAFLTEHEVAEHDLTDEVLGEADLDAVRSLRGRVRKVIDLRDPDDIADAAAALTSATSVLTLVTDEAGRRAWQAVPRPKASPADRLALFCGVGVLGALRALGPERFRDCASPTCTGAFIDTSRPGRRRYCMPDLCGNRAWVAAYRARHRLEPEEVEEVEEVEEPEDG
jgi:predicted RNA-binding Zn ribbon-like protein